MNKVAILDDEVVIKEIDNQRVLMFKDIDRIHQRKPGTSYYNFKKNKEHFIVNEDYFVIKPANLSNGEIPLSGITREDINQNKGVIFLTEPGYLLAVKSLNDDFAWKIQRMLIKNYFWSKRTHQQQQIQSALVPDNVHFLVESFNNTMQQMADAFAEQSRMFSSIVSRFGEVHSRQQGTIDTLMNRLIVTQVPTEELSVSLDEEASFPDSNTIDLSRYRTCHSIAKELDINTLENKPHGNMISHIAALIGIDNRPILGHANEDLVVVPDNTNNSYPVILYSSRGRRRITQACYEYLNLETLEPIYYLKDSGINRKGDLKYIIYDAPAVNKRRAQQFKIANWPNWIRSLALTN